MALRKKETEPAAQPAFEGMETGNAESATAVADAKPEAAPSAQDTAKVSASTAIAKAQAGTVAVATPGRKFKPALTEFQDVIGQDDIEALGIGAFPRITADLSGLVQDKTKELGKSIKLELLSWNLRYIVTPGVDNDEANSLVRYSNDGVTISGTGESVADYVKQLRDVDGYEKASIKTYMDLWGNLAEVDGAAVDPVDRAMVVVQLSPQSMSQFKALQMVRGVKISQGLVSADELGLITITGATKTLNNKRFGFMEFKG